MELTDEEEYRLNQLYAYQQLLWFVEVVRLREGGSFGELALIKDKPRAATINCLSACQFLAIKREDYQRVLQRSEQKALLEKINFFSHLPFLHK